MYRHQKQDSYHPGDRTRARSDTRICKQYCPLSRLQFEWFDATIVTWCKKQTDTPISWPERESCFECREVLSNTSDLLVVFLAFDWLDDCRCYSNDVLHAYNPASLYGVVPIQVYIPWALYLFCTVFLVFWLKSISGWGEVRDFLVLTPNPIQLYRGCRILGISNECECV